MGFFGGGGGGFVSNLFGANGDPISGFGQNESQLAAMYNPWSQKGLDANNFLYTQDQNNMQNPNALQNQIASGWQTSPYQQNLMNMTTQRMNANAANTGMLGSPSSQNYLNSQLNDMTGQFQNDYVNRGMQTYGMGQQNMNQIADRGLNALNSQTGLSEQSAIAQMKAQQQNNMLLPNMIGTAAGIGMGMYGAGMFGGGMGGDSGAMQSYGNGSFKDPGSGLNEDFSAGYM